MVAPELPSQLVSLDYFFEIAGGRGADLKLDKGGYWSPQDRIWVDGQFKSRLEAMSVQERLFVQTLAPAGLAVGRIFEKQLTDSDLFTLWPEEVFEEGGSERLLDAASGNLSILDPYSILPYGLDHPSIPYSQAYAQLLLPLRKLLLQASTISGSQSSENHYEYLTALSSAFNPNQTTRSDLPFMREADRRWVEISPETPLLVLAEPAEVYYDPLRLVSAQHPNVAKWVNTVTDLIGIPPWRTFFEFRLLAKDESMVTLEEISAIRAKSRELFQARDDPQVPVSTEFRRLLLASGNGAHPAKTAKNYPNFEDIRDRVGYKNILYTNMIEEGVRTCVIPALNQVLGIDILSDINEAQLIRGSALRILAHEENHPFRKFRDSPIEELKATVQGLHAVIESGHFSKEDIRAMIMTEIGAMLWVRHQINQTQIKGDSNTAKSLEAYSRADTIMMNYLFKSQALSIDHASGNIQIDFETFKTSLGNLVQELDQVRTGDLLITIPQFYSKYENNSVWDQVKVLPSPII